MMELLSMFLSIVSAVFLYLWIFRLQPYIKDIVGFKKYKGNFVLEIGGDFHNKGRVMEYVLIAPQDYGLKTVGFRKCLSKSRVTHLLILFSDMNGAIFQLQNGCNVFFVSEDFIPEDEKESDVQSMVQRYNWKVKSKKIMRLFETQANEADSVQNLVELIRLHCDSELIDV